MTCIENVIDKKLCISCGFCKAYSNSDLNFKYNNDHEASIPEIVKEVNFEDDIYCPSDSIDMPKNSLFKYNVTNPKSILGVYKNLYAGYSNDKQVRKKAASGGIVPEVIKYLLEKKYIDYVFTSVNINGHKDAKSIIIDDPKAVKFIHGATYHSVNLSEAFQKLSIQTCDLLS